MKKEAAMVKIISQKNLNRLFFIIIVALALAAGFFQSAYETEQRKYKKLEDQFVRLKMMLGQTETDELIEASYQKIDNQGQIVQ